MNLFEKYANKSDVVAGKYLVCERMDKLKRCHDERW